MPFLFIFHGHHVKKSPSSSVYVPHTDTWTPTHTGMPPRHSMQVVNDIHDISSHLFTNKQDVHVNTPVFSHTRYHDNKQRQHHQVCMIYILYLHRSSWAWSNYTVHNKDFSPSQDTTYIVRSDLIGHSDMKSDWLHLGHLKSSYVRKWHTMYSNTNQMWSKTRNSRPQAHQAVKPSKVQTRARIQSALKAVSWMQAPVAIGDNTAFKAVKTQCYYTICLWFVMMSQVERM